jgi:hypothetical protein
MPSATIRVAANTNANTGFYSGTNSECDPGGSADCNTDSDTRDPSPAPAHSNPHAGPF